MTRVHPSVGAYGAPADAREAPPSKVPRVHAQDPEVLMASPRRAEAGARPRAEEAWPWAATGADPGRAADVQLLEIPSGAGPGRDAAGAPSYFGIMVDMLASATLEEGSAAVLRDIAGGIEEVGPAAAAPPPAAAPAPVSPQPAAAAASVGPFTPQPAPVPYLFSDEEEAGAAEAALGACASKLASSLQRVDERGQLQALTPPRRPRGRPPKYIKLQQQLQLLQPAAPPPTSAELATSLAQALSDARLLGTPLFTTPGGRLRLRRMFATLRFAGYPQLARGVLEALVAALQQSPSGFWTPAAAETLVDHATALFLACTAEAPRTAHDLFALDWELCSRLLGRVQLLGGELGAGPGTLRPKALLFCATAFNWFDKSDEAFGMYFEAWAELVRRQLTPGPLEAALVPALADLHFAYLMPAMGHHIASKAYSLGGDSAVARYTQYLVLHVRTPSAPAPPPPLSPLPLPPPPSPPARRIGQIEATRGVLGGLTALRARKEIGKATALSREALEVAEGLGPGYAHVLARMLSIHAQNLLFGGRLHASTAGWLRAIRAQVELGDPSFADVDFIPHQLVRPPPSRSPGGPRHEAYRLH
eukprot:tig00021326_g20277.t1